MEKISTQNNSINILKIICAILVVYIHTTPLTSYCPYINAIIFNFSRIAVPTFYCISAYFLTKKIDDINCVINYLKKLLIIYLFWLGIVIFNILIQTYNIEYTINKTIFAFLQGNYQFWYIRDLFFLVIIFYLINHFKLNKYFKIVCIICTIFMFLLIIIGRFYTSDFISLLFPKLKIFTWRSFLNIPFFYLGILISRKNEILINICNFKLILFLTISLILFLSEIFIVVFVDKSYCILLFDNLIFPSSFFVILFLIILLLKNNKELSCKQNKISIFIKNTSAFIYYSHMLVYFSILNFYISNPILCFFVTIAICFVLSYLFLKLNNKKILYIAS